MIQQGVYINSVPSAVLDEDGKINPSLASEYVRSFRSKETKLNINPTRARAIAASFRRLLPGLHISAIAAQNGSSPEIWLDISVAEQLSVLSAAYHIEAIFDGHEVTFAAGSAWDVLMAAGRVSDPAARVANMVSSVFGTKADGSLRWVDMFDTLSSLAPFKLAMVTVAEGEYNRVLMDSQPQR